MTILITGAGGQLGHLVIDALLARGADTGDLVAGARTTAKADDLRSLGVRTVHLDYAEPDTVRAALAGVDDVLLISGSDPGTRVAGHRAVIAAAADAGVRKLVYTSAPKASTFDWPLGAEHRETEEILRESGLPTVIVRNNWYTENYLPELARARETGVIAAAVGQAQVASASRADYADGAAVVLLEDGHLGRVYEFGGDAAWGYEELASAAGEVLGRDVTFAPITSEQQRAALMAAGLDEGTAAFVASMDAGIAGGVLADTDGTLSRLIGRPATPLVDGLRSAWERSTARD